MQLPSESTVNSLRVLCLHGFRTNKKIMADQLVGLRRTLQQAYRDLDIEFVYINGLLEATGPSDSIIESFYEAHKPFYEWWPLPQEFQVVDPANVNGGIASIVDQIGQRNSEDTWCAPYDRMDETIAYAHDKIEKLGTFDMAVGFSQGSALLTVLTMWYLKHYQSVPWKLNVCVSGLRVDGPAVRSVFTSDDGSLLQVPIPSVHIIGKLDPLVLETHKLTNMYQTWDQDKRLKVVLEHEGGHRFPSLKQDPGIYQPVVRMLHEVCPHLAIAGLEHLTFNVSVVANATNLVSRL